MRGGEGEGLASQPVGKSPTCHPSPYSFLASSMGGAGGLSPASGSLGGSASLEVAGGVSFSCSSTVEADSSELTSGSEQGGGETAQGSSCPQRLPQHWQDPKLHPEVGATLGVRGVPDSPPPSRLHHQH